MSRYQEGMGPAEAVGIEYLDGLYSYAMILTGESAESEEIVQKTYIRAMLTMESEQPVGKAKCLFFTILRDIWFNQRGWCDAHQGLEIEVDDAMSSSTVVSSKNSHDLDMREMDAQQMRAVIQKLPIQFREIILLRDYEEFSCQEIAAILDCPSETVISCLRMARAKLLTLLSATLEGSSLLRLQSLQSAKTIMPLKFRLRLLPRRLTRQQKSG